MKKKTILISPADSEILNFFSGLFNVVESDTIEHFINFEQNHADMQALNINSTLFVNSASNNLIKQLEKSGVQYIKCENIGGKYPENVALNAALVGDKLLCKESALHQKVRAFCMQNNIRILDVKQGYTKCSVIILNENAIITDDKSIYKSATDNKIKVLLVEKEDIRLTPMHKGFIGGCCAVIGDTVYFFGDIKKHRNYKEIKQFIESENLNIICVTNETLYDIGGIVEL